MASFSPSPGDALLRELSSRLQEIPIQLGQALASGTTHDACPQIVDPTAGNDKNCDTNSNLGPELLVCEHRKKWTESSTGWSTPKSLTSSTPDLSLHHMRFDYEDHKETDVDSDDNQEFLNLNLHSVDLEANLSRNIEPRESARKSVSNIFLAAVSGRYQETSNLSHGSCEDIAKDLDALKETLKTAQVSTENKTSSRAIKLSRPDHKSIMFLSGVDTLGGLPLEADNLSPLNRFPSHLHPRSSRLTNCSLGDQTCFRFWRRSSCPVLASTKESFEEVDYQQTWTRSNTLEDNKRPFISCLGDFQKLKGFNGPATARILPQANQPLTSTSVGNPLHDGSKHHVQQGAGVASAVNRDDDCQSDIGSSASQSLSLGVKSQRDSIRESKNNNSTDCHSDESSSSSSDSPPSANSSSSADESC